MHCRSGSYCKGKEHPPRSCDCSTCCSMMNGKPSAQVSRRGFLSFFVLFQWLELPESLARFSFAYTAKKPWYSLEHHASVFVTAGTGTHCHLCPLLGHWVFLWPSLLAILIIAPNSSTAQDFSLSYHKWRTQWEAIVCLKMASKWRRASPTPFKLSPVYWVLHQSGEWTARFMLNAKGSSVAESHDLSSYPFFKGCLSFPWCH